MFRFKTKHHQAKYENTFPVHLEIARTVSIVVLLTAINHYIGGSLAWGLDFDAWILQPVVHTEHYAWLKR